VRCSTWGGEGWTDGGAFMPSLNFFVSFFFQEKKEKDKTGAGYEKEAENKDVT